MHLMSLPKMSTSNRPSFQCSLKNYWLMLDFNEVGAMGDFYNQSKSGHQASIFSHPRMRTETVGGYKIFPVFSLVAQRYLISLKKPFPIDHKGTMHADVSAVGRWFGEVYVTLSSGLTSGPYVFDTKGPGPRLRIKNRALGVELLQWPTRAWL